MFKFVLRLLPFLAFALVLQGQSLDSTYLVRIERINDLSDEHFFLADSLSETLLEELDEKELSLSYQTKYLIYRGIGNLKADHGFFEEANVYFQNSLQQAEKVNEKKLLVKALGRLAENQLDMNLQDQAIETALKALNIGEELQDHKLMGIAQSSLAETYRHAAKLNLAEKYNLRAVESYKRAGDWNQVARCYNNFAATIGKLGRNQEAIDTLKKALAFVDEENLFARGKHYSNIGYCFRNMEEYDSALYYNIKSLNIKKQINDSWGIGYSLGAIGRCYIGLEQYDSAIFYTRQSYDTTLKYKNLYRIKDAAQYVSDAYRAAGAYEKALYYSDINKKLDDSIFVEETSSKIDLLQRKYDLSKKEAEIAHLKNQQKLDKANQQTTLAILLGALFLVIAFALYFRLRANKRIEEKRLVEMELKNSQEELQRSQAELENYTWELMEKNKSIKQFQQKVITKEQELEKFRKQKSNELEQLAELKILTDEDWRRFKLLFDRVYPDFFEKLTQSSLSFTKGEKRLLGLTKLNMSHSEIADTLGISSESVSKSRFRLKKKLTAVGIENIEDYLKSL